MRAAVIAPTFNAGPAWSEWISALLATGINVNDVYIIDSGSIDNTVQQSSDAGFNIKRIESSAFNHGGTRQLAVTSIADYDFVVFLTQDAVLYDPDSIQNIISPFDDEQVGAVCGRQLPALNAGAIEAHARLSNYPETSITHSINDVDEKGLKAAFLSNSFAAYRVSALNAVGGFPEHVIFGEDMYVAAKLLKSSWKIAYAADACVYHSHNYSIFQEMQRYFDMGVFHAREPWLRTEFGKAESQGLKFVKSELRHLAKYAIWRIPEALLRTIFRYTGFKLGLVEQAIPKKLKALLSMNSGYFR